MTIPATDKWELEEGRLLLDVSGRWDEIETLAFKSTQTRGGFLSFDINLPKRPRSTGEKSQNHHLWGHAEQIGEHLGYDRREMLYLIAEMTPGWPMAEYKGKMVPKSESAIDSETSNQAIEVSHRIAAENGIRLREGDE